MSAPLVWILFPGLLAGLLLSFHRRELLVSIVATLVALLLAGLALWLPTEEQIFVGSWTFSFSETYSIFGRQFILAATDRPTLMVLYLGTALWFGAANIARTGSLFVPLGFGMVVLLTARRDARDGRQSGPADRDGGFAEYPLFGWRRPAGRDWSLALFNFSDLGDAVHIVRWLDALRD